MITLHIPRDVATFVEEVTLTVDSDDDEYSEIRPVIKVTGTKHGPFIIERNGQVIEDGATFNVKPAVELMVFTVMNNTYGYETPAAVSISSKLATLEPLEAEVASSYHFTQTDTLE